MSSLLLLATLLPVVLNFGCILIYLVYQKCRARTQEEGSADWDDVIWFRGKSRQIIKGVWPGCLVRTRCLWSKNAPIRVFPFVCASIRSPSSTRKPC